MKLKYLLLQSDNIFLFSVRFIFNHRRFPVRNFHSIPRFASLRKTILLGSVRLDFDLSLHSLSRRRFGTFDRTRRLGFVPHFLGIFP